MANSWWVLALLVAAEAACIYVAVLSIAKWLDVRPRRGLWGRGR